MVDRKYRSFELAREYTRSLGLKSNTDWENYCKIGKLPKDIPTHPERVYKKEWISWGDWLGTGRIAHKRIRIADKHRKYRSFQDARAFVHTLKLKGTKEWENYCKIGKLPKDIPTHPERQYKDKGWINWGDWLGTGRIADQEKGWSLHKVKELIRDLIKNKAYEDWSEDVRCHILLARGLLNIRSDNRFSKLLQNLVFTGPNTEDQRKALEDFVNSDNDDDKNIPDIGGEEIPILSTEKLAEMVEEEGHTDPLEEQTIESPRQILLQTEYLESFCHDIELMQFFVKHFVYKLWRSVFSEQDQKEKGTTLNTVKSQGLSGKNFYDTVVRTFLSEYDEMESLKVPEGYTFPESPRVMQKYAAYRIKRDPFFCNLSGTGAGKTLSAILASRVIDSKMKAGNLMLQYFVYH